MTTMDLLINEEGITYVLDRGYTYFAWLQQQKIDLIEFIGYYFHYNREMRYSNVLFDSKTTSSS